MIITPEISRVAKVIVDSGFGSFADAEARLRAATLTIHVDPACAGEPAAQAAVLTAVATGVRCFLGGVWLTGAIDQSLILPTRGETLGAAAVMLGCRTDNPSAGRIILVGPPRPATGGWLIRAWWDDWKAGVRPSEETEPIGYGWNSLAGVAAGALAVAQAFLAERGDGHAGRVAHTISLWSPGSSENGPHRFYLPDALWLIGLGNLGQAYLWCLGLLPYRDPHDLQLVFQDEDTVRDANWGTSVLVRHGCYGMLKTRMAEDRALERGFRVRRLDQFLDGSILRRQTDPPIALSGLDRIAPRKMMAAVGFERVIDCGLGATARSYGRFRLNVFDATYTATKHFAGMDDQLGIDHNLRLSAYQREIAANPAAACGMAELAGASVAVPFVSVFVATLAVTQAIRIASGQEHARAVVGAMDCVGAIRITTMPTIGIPRVGFAETEDTALRPCSGHDC